MEKPIVIFIVLLILTGIFLWARFVRVGGIKTIFFWGYGLFVLLGFPIALSNDLIKLVEQPPFGPCTEYVGQCFSLWSFVLIYMSVVVSFIAFFLYTRRVLAVGFILNYVFLAVAWLGFFSFFSIPRNPELGFGAIYILYLGGILVVVSAFSLVAMPIWVKRAFPKFKL